MCDTSDAPRHDSSDHGDVIGDGVSDNGRSHPRCASDHDIRSGTSSGRSTDSGDFDRRDVCDSRDVLGSHGCNRSGYRRHGGRRPLSGEPGQALRSGRTV